MTLAPPELRELRVPRARREPRVHKGSRARRETWANEAPPALKGCKGHRARKEIWALRGSLELRVFLPLFRVQWDLRASSQAQRDRRDLRAMSDTPGRRALKDYLGLPAQLGPLDRRGRKGARDQRELKGCPGQPH